MNKSAIILFLIMALVGSLAKKSTIRIDYAGSCADFQRTDAKTLQVSTVHGESCLPISPFFAFKDVNDVAFTYKCRASHKKAGMSVIRIDLTATSNYTVSLIPHKPIRARGDFNYKRRPACMVSNIAACTNETSKCHEMPVELTPNGYVSHFDRIYLVRQGVEMNVCYVQNRTCCHYLAHEKGICMIEYQAPINSIHKREEQAGEGETEEGTEEETRTEEEGEEAGLEGTTESTDNTEAKKEEQETEPETNKPEQETEGEAKKDEQEAPKKDEQEKTEAEKEKEEMDKKSGVKPLGRAGEDRDKKFLDGNQLDETYTEGDRSHPYKLPLCINAPGSLACVVLENDRPPKQHEGYYNGHNSNGHKSNSVLKPAPKYKFQPFVSRDGLHQDVNGNFFEVSFDEERERYNDDQKRKVPQ